MRKTELEKEEKRNRFYSTKLRVTNDVLREYESDKVEMQKKLDKVVIDAKALEEVANKLKVEAEETKGKAEACQGSKVGRIDRHSFLLGLCVDKDSFVLYYWHFTLTRSELTAIWHEKRNVFWTPTVQVCVMGALPIWTKTYTGREFNLVAKQHIYMWKMAENKSAPARKTGFSCTGQQQGAVYFLSNNRLIIPTTVIMTLLYICFLLFSIKYEVTFWFSLHHPNISMCY